MNKKIKLLILFLIGFGLIFCRFLYLDRFPVGMSHDELEYILSAKTYFLTGADLSGSYFPNSIFQTKTEGIISFLPALILAPYFGLVPINQFTARLPYVLFSLITSVCLYLLIKKIFKNKYFAGLTSIIYLINPWSFYLSRVAADTAFCLLFFILGILFCLDNNKKKYWLSLVFFTLGFLSYHGAKVIFLPLIFVCLGYNFLKKKITFKQGMVFWVISGLIMTSYFIIGGKFFSQSINQTRSNDIWILDQKTLTNKVNIERKASLENPGDRLFINKATIATKIFFQKYLTAFSPEVLFISGDTRGTYRFGDFGLFYLIDFVFIFLGLINLFKKHPKETYFLLSLVLISPLATALSGVETSIINRSFLLLPVLIIFISFGIWSVYKKITKKKMKLFWGSILFMVYVISFWGFLAFYFYRFPVIGQENYFFSQRIVANYIEKIDNQKVVAITKEPRELFLETVFYSKNNNNLVLKDFIKNQNLKLKNTSFVSDCPKLWDKNTIYIIENKFYDCLPKNEEFKSINEEQFNGPLYYIKNDSLCLNFEIQPWLRFRLAKDYKIEKLDNKTFCQTWIRKIL